MLGFWKRQAKPDPQMAARVREVSAQAQAAAAHRPACVPAARPFDRDALWLAEDAHARAIGGRMLKV